MSRVQPTRQQGSAALSRDELEALSQREAKPGSPVLSVYLDTDQSREINIERGFEVVLKDLLRETGQKLDKDTRKEFDADAERVQQSVERQREAELVEQIITAAGKREKGALGIDQTLLALQEGRVWKLVYAEGFVTRGGQCAKCGALLAKDAGTCDYCNGPIRVMDDLIGFAAEHVLETGGKVEEVRGPVAEGLREVGSFGAVLRF